MLGGWARGAVIRRNSISIRQINLRHKYIKINLKQSDKPQTCIPLGRVVTSVFQRNSSVISVSSVREESESEQGQ